MKKEKVERQKQMIMDVINVLINGVREQKLKLNLRIQFKGVFRWGLEYLSHRPHIFAEFIHKQAIIVIYLNRW